MVAMDHCLTGRGLATGPLARDRPDPLDEGRLGSERIGEALENAEERAREEAERLAQGLESAARRSPRR